MRNHGQYELHLFESHGRDLAACETFADLAKLDPGVRFARDREADVLAMYRRYASEIDTFFTRARPTLTPAEPQRRKEEDHDLFAAVG